MIKYLAIPLLIALFVWSWRKPRAAGAIIWAFITTMMLSAALLVLFQENLIPLAFWLTTLMTAIWVGFSLWSYIDNKAWRPVVSMMLITLISTILLITLDPIQ